MGNNKLVLILVWVLTTNNDVDNENLGLHGPASTISQYQPLYHGESN